jgi:hypothetical protein
VVWQQAMQGAGSQWLDLPNLPQGTYWVSYQQEGQALQTFSFIKF